MYIAICMDRNLMFACISLVRAPPGTAIIVTPEQTATPSQLAILLLYRLVCVSCSIVFHHHHRSPASPSPFASEQQLRWELQEPARAAQKENFRRATLRGGYMCDSLICGTHCFANARQQTAHIERDKACIPTRRTRPTQ